MGVVMEVGPFASEKSGVVVVRLLRACVDLCWPLLAVVGCCGPLLTCIDRHWVLWAFVGLHWPSMGCCGPVLAFVGRRRVLWAFMGLRCPSVGFRGCRPSQRGVSW